MKKFLFFVLVTIPVFVSTAQTVILEREEDGIMDTSFTTIFEEEAEKKIINPSINGLGFPVTQSEPGAEIENGTSIQLIFGSATLYKFNRILAGGINGTYNFYNYRLAQNPEKVFPIVYAESNKETFRLNCLQFGPAFNINFTPNRTSKTVSLDIGSDAVWVMGSNHRTWNENEDGSITKVKTRKLDYVRTFHYISYARIGLGAVALYCSYRMTDVFTEESLFPELPNVNAGIGFTFK
ncbi:MAG: hypothetical protein ACKVPJ_01750 [Chitinophagales bacterium]